MELKNKIQSYPDFPKKGIVFRDIWPLVGDPDVFNFITDSFERHFRDKGDVIVGIESRGFVFGVALANRLRKPFVPIRKQGKLPGNTVAVNYEIEYGKDAMEIQSDVLSHGQRVIIIDDLLATGGTASAAVKLVEKIGGDVIGLGFVVTLNPLQGMKKIEGYNIVTLTEYD